ncbi:carboxypeptidase-like regulatory domain-containing protein [Melioribacter sp. Ez-97]|uniref:carboxypeptidase-like regulatory domain-containing protein n=1 Tax=Melioribacter sp. Ez-97 TaxID=3423434 RepID=UPI003EDB2001
MKGVVTDSATAEPLIGANVFLMGTSLGSATNIEGEYHISRIPAGTYDVKISYVGYKPKILQVTIQNNRTLVLDVPLVADVIEGTEITITAQAVGQVAAINQQLSSNTIVNVVSEEKIQELPDANAAESIGRLPGVSLIRSGGEANKVILRGLSGKYLSVTVDGVRLPATDALERGLDLSTISQSSLAGIELYKALTPDKDADAIAGSINLVTKKAPEVRDLRFVSKGGYNGIMDSFGQYDFSLKYGERFFDNLLGVQVNGNIERKIRSNERIDISYSTTGENQSDYFIGDLELEFTDEIRYRKGAGLILDINTPDEGNIKLNTTFSTTTRDYLVHSRNYPVTEASVAYIFRDREQTIDIFSSALTGENNLFGLNTN